MLRGGQVRTEDAAVRVTRINLSYTSLSFDHPNHPNHQVVS